MEFYTGSKFALEGITDSMRYSLAPFNIAVTNVNAGPVRTNITNSLGNTGTYRQVEDRTQYLSFLSQSMLENLNRSHLGVFLVTFGPA
jgi:NAD(P)-dependent dehydrogenase (short-subunit alcohol dehydrogenase family)